MLEYKCLEHLSNYAYFKCPFPRVRRILMKSHQQGPTPQYSRFEGNIKIARRYSFLDSNDLMIFGNNRKIQNDSIRVTVFVNRINQWNDHVWNDRKDWGLTRKLTKSIMGKLKHSDWDFHCWFFLSVKENKLIANERRRRALFKCFCLNITTKKNILWNCFVHSISGFQKVSLWKVRVLAWAKKSRTWLGVKLRH